jgi:hypothetical protein
MLYRRGEEVADGRIVPSAVSLSRSIMLRGFLYALALVGWVGVSVVYPQWTGWVHTRESISNYGGKEPPGGLRMIWLRVPVSPTRAPLWDPPGSLKHPDATVPVRWPWQPRPGTSYTAPSVVGLGFQITCGVLALGLTFGWSYPFRARPPDYTAGVALGASLGVVAGWIVLVPFVMVTSGTSLSTGYAFGAPILSTLTIAGALYGVRGVRRVQRFGPTATVVASEGYGGLVVQGLWFVGGVILGVISQSLVWEAAEELSRLFGWALQRDPTFGTYSHAPAITTAAALYGMAALIVSWVRWRTGPRALVLGLAIAALAGTALKLS